MALGLGKQLDETLQMLTDEVTALRERIRKLEAGGSGQLAYTVSGAAEAMGVGEHNIRELIRSKQLPAFRLDSGKHRYMIYRHDLEEFIGRRKAEE